MSKNVDNLHIFRNFTKLCHQYEHHVKYVRLSNTYKYFTKLGHQYENYLKYGQNSGQSTYFQKFLEIRPLVQTLHQTCQII